jgi:HSP20 family molecular chaperone IbpA
MIQTTQPEREQRKASSFLAGIDKGRPASEIHFDDTGSAYFLHLPVPGFGREDFSIRITDNVLIIEAGQKPQQFGGRSKPGLMWEKRITLPADADGYMTQTSYRSGELNIHIPKTKKAEEKISVPLYVY